MQFSTKSETVAKETALHKSSRLIMDDCTRLLVEHGANTNVPNAASETPLHLAARYLRDLARGTL